MTLCNLDIKHWKEMQNVLQIMLALHASVRFTELLSSVSLLANLYFFNSAFSEIWTSYQRKVSFDAIRNCVFLSLSKLLRIFTT